MSKRVISFFLAAVMLLSLFSVASAETIGDGKAKTVTIEKGQTMNIFKTTSGVRLIGNAWEYTTDTDVTGPAYCINWGLLDPAETRKLTIAGRYTASPKTTGAFANGYPQRPLSDFKSINSADYPSISSLTELEYAYATQLAVWASLGQIAVQGTSFTDGRAMLAVPSGTAQEKRIYDAMQIILKNAASWDRQLYTGMYFRLSRNEAGSSLNIEHRDGIFGAERDGMYEIKRETINGVEYFTRTFTVSSATSTYKYDYFIDIYASNAPEGTVFCDLSNKEFETVTRSGIKYWRVPTEVEKTVMNENGMEYVGDFKICIPVRNTPESAEIQLHATSVVSQFNIYLANNSEDSEQSFIIADPMYITLSATGEMKWDKVVSPYGRFVLNKTDGMGRALQGAVFELRGNDGSVHTGTSDANGQIVWEYLEPDVQYTLNETEVPKGYIKAEAQTLSVPEGQTLTVGVRNVSERRLTIRKIDAQNGSPLIGATFRIEQIDGSYKTDVTTGHSGAVEFHGSELPFGTYKVYEIKAPNGYVENPEPQTFEWKGTSDVTLTFKNVREMSLVIVKKDAETHLPLSGVVFWVYKDGRLITDVETDGAGYARVSGLQEGYYEVQETAAPEGYILDETRYGIHIDPYDPATDDDPVLVLTNTRKPSLVIHKVDSVTKDALEGAKFRITYASNNTFFGEINDLGVFQTDDNGRIEIFNLKDGWYKIEETDAPDGYERAEETKEIYIGAGQRREITFENTPLSGMVIKKVDGSTGKVLQGAKFCVSYLSGTSGTGGTVIGEYTTSVNGTIVLNRLKAGTYVVEETKAPDGYVMSDAPETVHITGKEQSVVTVEFENFSDSALLIKKLDKNTGEPLYGAVFKVTRDDGSLVGNANGRYTTDRNGEILIPNLPTDTYIVAEVQAPDGYTLDSTPKTIKLRSGETHELEFYNESIGGLRITKLDEETRSPIRNVEFEVEHINGRRIGTYRTDSNGVINISGLPNGWYTVTETSAARGYIIDEEPRDVEVKDGEITRITVTNRKSSSFLIHKLDSTTGKGIYGVTFLVSDRYGNPIATYTSDHNGYVYMDDRELTDGKYYIREISAPKGYVIDPEVKTFYVGYGETSSITWYNTPTQAQIQIIKKSADYNTVNGLPEGSLLEGAVFEIYDRGGNIVDTIKTDRNGRATSKTLPLGLYTIRETQAPPYYSANETLMTANLEFSGQIVTFEVLNKSVSTGVSITKTGYNEVMPNNPVVYTFKNIANTSSVPLGSFYWRDTLPWAVRAGKLVTGTYNRDLNYKVVYRTNISGGEYRTVNDNLSTRRNYALDISRTALGLAADEYITEIMFVFGTVPAGFAQVETPYLYARSIYGLTNGTSFVNQADVGGTYNGQWITSVSRWVTKVYNYTHFEMPKTGY